MEQLYKYILMDLEGIIAISCLHLLSHDWTAVQRKGQYGKLRTYRAIPFSPRRSIFSTRTEVSFCDKLLEIKLYSVLKT